MADAVFVGPERIAVVGYDTVTEAGSGETLVATVLTPSGTSERIASYGPRAPRRLELADPDFVLPWKNTNFDPLTGSPATLEAIDSPLASAPALVKNPTLRWVDARGETIHDFDILGVDVGAPLMDRETVIDHQRERAKVRTRAGTLHCLDLRTGRVIATKQASAVLDSMVLHPDGTRLFAGCNDTTTQVWDTQSLERAVVFRGRHDRVIDLEISPDGSTLYSASDDCTVRRWTTEPSRLQELHD